MRTTTKKKKKNAKTNFYCFSFNLSYCGPPTLEERQLLLGDSFSLEIAQSLEGYSHSAVLAHKRGSTAVSAINTSDMARYEAFRNK